VSQTPAPLREAFHARVADGLERAFNPIMLKELRATLRGLRFFISHLVILCLFTTGLMLAFLSLIPSRPGGYDDPGDPSVVGRRVYLITQLLQLGVAFLVVPGLAATSISSERDSLTHDLLLTTTMTARQIVWGKFTAAMTQAFTIFVSMVPLVSLCFLFGGVTVYQILANYVFLFALSALMISYALSMSASARSTQRAVGSVYGLTLLGGGVMAFFLGGLWRRPAIDGMLVAYGFLPPDESSAALGAVDRILFVHLIPGFLWAALTSLFFINATSRLKPLFANRSTPLRIYFLTVLFGAGAIVTLTLYHSLPPNGPTDDRSFALMVYAIVTLTASLLGSLFACEEPLPPSHLARTADSFRGSRRLLRLLWPGSDSGAAFTLGAVGLFLALSYAAFVRFADGFNRGSWTGAPASLPVAVGFGMVFCWTFFTSMFARYLAALLPERPMMVRTILILTCLFLALFPLVHWAIAEAIDRDVQDVERRNGPATLALSPVMAILSALDLRAGRRDFPLYAGPAPVAVAFAAFSLITGIAFHALGNRARAKLLSTQQRATGTPEP
jgi:ABC-type transport system involved in multi-copper enzyme maturation permease subunit